MALRKCLYCAKEISEYAVKCPNCGRDKPLDKQAKQEKERKLRIEEERKTETEQAISGYIQCEECHSEVNILDVLRSNSKTVCKTCGFPDITVKCIICGNPAKTYDPDQKAFACHEHYTETCSACGRKVRGSQKVFRTRGTEYHETGYFHCRSCADNYSRLKKGGGCLGGVLLLMSTIFSLLLFVARLLVKQ